MGLEAALTVERPRNCPIADASAASGSTITSVTRSSVADDVVTEEFELDADADVDSVASEEVREVFGDDRRTVYRFERESDQDCVCTLVETFGCPVADIRAVEGRLHVVFRPTDLETLREVVETLRERFGDVRLEHLVQSITPEEGDTVVVDRGRLTDRQREVLRTAYEMGYFEHPKGANAGEVAATLEINSATLRAHLAAAQSKLLEEILNDATRSKATAL